MDKIKTDKAILRRFGLTMALCFAVIAMITFLRHKHFWASTSVISLFFLLSACCFPGLLKYFYVGWMKLAFVLGWVNTRLLLVLIFYLVFAPIGLIMRIFRIDHLDKRFNRGVPSYWKPKETGESSLKDYERQF